MTDWEPKKITRPMLEIINDRSRKSEVETSPEARPGDIFRSPGEIARIPRRQIRNQVQPQGVSEPEDITAWNPWKE